MSFFQSLSAVGITKADLLNLDEAALIRIEKKLVAEQRLNGTITKNDTEQILQVLQNYPRELKLILDYPCLYGIITGEPAEYIDTIKRLPKVQIARLRHLLSNYFRDDLDRYISTCMQNDNWNDLRVLLHYKVYIEPEVFDSLKEKLSGKLDYTLAIFRQQLPHRTLRKKVPYLNSEFFELLGELDNQYFTADIDLFLMFIAQAADYTRGTVFFDNFLRSLNAYNAESPQLRLRIRNATIKYGGQQWKVYAFLGIFLFLIVSVFIIIGSGSGSAHRSLNYPGSDMGQSEPNLGEMIDPGGLKRQVENFVKARINAVNYPLNSWKTDAGRQAKFNNPFLLPAFERDAAGITKGDRSVCIFNQTGEECILIAYYYSTTETGENNVRRMKTNNPPQIHPMYIPAHDSIKIDLEHLLLRFYMGRRLAAFNTYKHNYYPDSTDLKFSRFTPADSMLFSKGLMLSRDAVATKGVLSVKIQQPSPDVFRVLWNGTTPLTQYAGFARYMSNKFKDSAMFNKPLTLDLKHQEKADPSVGDVEVDSFLN